MKAFATNRPGTSIGRARFAAIGTGSAAPVVALVVAVFAAVVATSLIAPPAAHAHGSSLGDLDIVHPYALPTPPGATTAGAYLKDLVNKGPADDALVAASSPAAERVEIHSMAMDGDIMRMRAVAGVPVPAKGHVAMAPGGGYHLMLIGIRQPLRVGDRIPMRLRFEKAGTVDVELHVQERDATEPHLH